jgi:Plavaka transposase
MMPEDVGRAARVVPDAGMSQMPLDEPEPELQTDDIRVSPQAVDSDDIIMAPPLTRAGRPKRRYRLPARYEDILPEGPAPIPPNDNAVAAPTSIRRVILHVRDVLRTGLNRFGIMREYPHRPSYDPDAFVKLKDLSNYSKDTPKPSESLAEVLPPPWPFKNMSIYLLMDWMNTGSDRKSVGEVDRLAKEILCHKEFNPRHLTGFSVRRENKVLDSSEPDISTTPFSSDAWIHSSVRISIPTGVKDPNGNGKNFDISGLHYRPLLGVMKTALTDEIARHFHFSPFKRFRSTASGDERCFDEVYTSDAFLKAHDTLQKQRNEPDCTLEKVVLGLMFWSDSTHLANFGVAKVWPLYLYFANLSKYIRCKPMSGASHHVAYIPSVSVNFIMEIVAA